MNGPLPPVERPEFDHAGRAADHVLALVVAADPAFRVTAERHDRMVSVLESIARVIASGR